MAMYYSLMETAIKNNAHPFYYIMYLLEKMPVYQKDITTSLLERMVPWSDEYRAYEAEKKHEVIQYFSDQETIIAPKTPTLKDRQKNVVA